MSLVLRSFESLGETKVECGVSEWDNEYVPSVWQPKKVLPKLGFGQNRKGWHRNHDTAYLHPIRFKRCRSWNFLCHQLNNIQKPIVRKNYSDSLSSFKTWSHIVVASYESQISYHQQPTILPRIIHHSKCCVSEVNIEQEALFASFVFGHFLGKKWHWIPLLRLVEEVYYEGLVPLGGTNLTNG